MHLPADANTEEKKPIGDRVKRGVPFQYVGASPYLFIRAV